MKFKIAKEAFPFFIPCIILAVVLYFINIHIAIAAVIFALYILYFFREPYRILPEGKNLILSPADGKVIAVDQVIEKEFFDEKVWRVSIFLSIFNVHVNYSPIDAKILYVKYTQGRFHSANLNKASIMNENNIIGMCNERGIRIIVKQIAGLIARRIVSDHNVGDHVAVGERIGLIRFGSRVEVYLPLNTSIKVQEGDKVKGKLTILGVIE